MFPEGYTIALDLLYGPTEHFRGILKADTQAMRFQEQREIVVRDCLVPVALMPGAAGPVVIMGTRGEKFGPFEVQPQEAAPILEIGLFDLLE